METDWMAWIWEKTQTFRKPLDKWTFKRFGEGYQMAKGIGRPFILTAEEASFIAHSREIVDYLLNRVEDLERDLDILKHTMPQVEPISDSTVEPKGLDPTEEEAPKDVPLPLLEERRRGRKKKRFQGGLLPQPTLEPPSPQEQWGQDVSKDYKEGDGKKNTFISEREVNLEPSGLDSKDRVWFIESIDEDAH